MHHKPQGIGNGSFNFGESQNINDNDGGYDLDESMEWYKVSSHSTGSRQAAGIMKYETPQ